MSDGFKMEMMKRQLWGAPTADIDFEKEVLRNQIALDREDDCHAECAERRLRRVHKLKMIEEFESLGCFVVIHMHGLLIDNKYVVAVAKNKWRNVNNMKWYWYKDVPDLVNKYFRKAV